MKFSAAVNRKWGWYKSIRFDWTLLHLHITDGSRFFTLICLCRELKRGWLITIRFVIHPIGHGMLARQYLWRGTDDFLGQ
jgi:hypothetical protein